MAKQLLFQKRHVVHERALINWLTLSKYLLALKVVMWF